MIAWDIDRDETRIVERKWTRISSLLFADDDSWLIVGRMTGALQFWMTFNENNRKLQRYYRQQIEGTATKKKKTEEEEGGGGSASSAQKQPPSEDDELVSPDSVSLSFEMKFEETVHSGPVFATTTANGVLISSAKPSNLEYESFFIDNVIWDIRSMQNDAKSPRLVSRMHNLNETENDITRLLDLSPVTPRHVREGGGPGTLLAASGDHAVYARNLVDILLDCML